MTDDKAAARYIREHSSAPSPALEWLTRETNLRTNHARMLSGQVQGTLLSLISRMISPSRILELGTFTGYSAICLAEGLRPDGILDTLEINDELQDLAEEAFSRAGVSDRIRMHIGDAKETLGHLDGPYDLVFIDANKREYCEYYNLVFDKVRSGGFILADNVLWDGKVFADPMPQDRQTVGIDSFNRMVADDPRVKSAILPVRDGLNIICKL